MNQPTNQDTPEINPADNININQGEANVDATSDEGTNNLQQDTMVEKNEQTEPPKTDDLVDYTWDRQTNPLSEFVKDEEISSFIEQAKKMGLNKSHVEEIIKYQNSKIEEKVKEINQQKEESLTALKSEFGKNVDIVISDARTAMKKVGVFDILVEKYGLGNDAELIKAFASINKAFSETAFPQNAGKSNLSIDEQIRELQAPEGPLMNRAHREHDIAVQKYKALIEQKAMQIK